MDNLPWQAQVRFSFVAHRRVVGKPNLFSLCTNNLYALSASYFGKPSHATIHTTIYEA